MILKRSSIEKLRVRVRVLKKNNVIKKLYISRSHQPKIKKVDLLLYSKLVGMLTKKGKRIGIKNSVDSAFVKLLKH
jgi:hypothetical protein